MPKRILEGEVVSNKTDKTITVLIERRFMHPIYKKYVKKTRKFSAHDPANHYKPGDRVRIIECPPVSKTKRWTVYEGDAPASAPKEKESKPAAKKPEPKKAEVKKPEAKKTEAEKTEAKKADTKKPETKKPETKKSEPKKAETKKSSAKKTTAKKTTAKKDTKAKSTTAKKPSSKKKDS